MHIRFRTSGGRGEYELVGHHITRDGQSVSARDMEGWSLTWSLHDSNTFESGLLVKSGDSGKPRLRIRPEYRNAPQVGRQMGSLLLLRPTRSNDHLSELEPVIGSPSYQLSKIGLGPDILLDAADKTITVTPTYVQIHNEVAEQTIWVEQRWEAVDQLHQMILEQELPDVDVELAAFIDQHRISLEQGPANPETATVTQRIFRSLDKRDNPHVGTGPHFVHNLVFGVDLEEVASPTAPTTLDHLALDDIPMRIQSAREMRLTNVRGATGARFSRQVREAWDHTCAFCGMRLPNTNPIRSGVDAAHILPWSHYELDRVDNGLCLCKMHHWAFDQMLLTIRHLDGRYFVEASVLMDLIEPSERESLSQVCGEIAQERLPSRPNQRPNPVYIDELYQGINLEYYA